MKNAWQVLGYDIRDAANAAEALEFGGLDEWKIRKEPLVTLWNEVDVLGTFALTSCNTKLLGVVGSRHKVIQNEELTPLLEVLREDGEFYAAGQTGSVVFVTIQRKDGDFLSVVNGHDAKTPLSTVYTPAAGPVLLDAQWRKTADLSARSAGEALQWADMGAEQAAIERMILKEHPMTPGEFRFRAAWLLTSGSSAATTTRNTNKLDTMTELFRDGTTAYDGLVALCTWYDHFSPVRGDDTVRARKAIFEPGFKRRALELMLKSPA